MQDIHAEDLPFLRANRIKGEYRDIDHYLDVQFRLLREDFLGPLRDGINEFLQHRRDPQHRYQDIRLYQNVQLLNPVCHPSGICYRIRFDVKPLRRVRWESTRRLIYGSLVCLSSDDFRTQMFATVANRTPESLMKGELEVMFQDNHREVSTIPPDRTFNMAETSAYFEAYRHVLGGLQQIGEDFPFKKHIVHCENQILSPRYLRAAAASPKYDLRSLVDENCSMRTTVDRARRRMRRLRLVEVIDSDSDTDSDTEADDGTDIQVESKSVGAAALQAVKVLDPRLWPTADHLSLDSSQREALIAALTNEMVLIQGPPGTGKTYVGLKIVRALVQNHQIWKPIRLDLLPADNHNSPILIVCYTNHALDQFLEGIAKFMRRGIVRVGGRCKSEILEPFKLAKQRYALREGHAIPRHIRDGRFDSWNDMQRCKEAIEEISFRINSLDNGLLHEDDLEPFISEIHYDSLCHGFSHARDIGSSRHMRNFTIFYHWLGLDGTVVRSPEEAAGQNQAEDGENDNGEPQDEGLIDIEDENEKEVQERMIGDDDHTAGHQQKEEHRKKELQQRADSTLALQLSHLEEADEDEGQSNNGGFGDWTTVGPKKGKSKNKLKKKIKRELVSQECMSEEDASQVENVWTLSTRDRWQLYRYWVNFYRRDLKEKVRGQEEVYHTAAERHKEVLEDEDRLIMQQAIILGMTTTCAAKYRRTLQQVRPKVIIVEEAAEVLEAHIVTTLSPGCEHLILIGDHQQLRPNPNVYKLAEKYHLKISLFERLIMNGLPCKVLERQHRMRPEISDVLQHIYPGLQDHQSVLNKEDIKGISKNMFYINHKQPEKIEDEMKSRTNIHEANFVSSLCWYLLLQGYTPEQITILTPYTGQLLAIRRCMPKKKFQGVRVTAVDNFQGEENDIIILSLVRSNNEGSIGFLEDDNRVCVSLSRAKQGFYVIGNFDLFASLSDLWSKVVQTLKETESIGLGLPLYCQNHPDSGIDARKDSDFQKAPEGGCTRPCDTRLDCGHVCVRACHTYDKDHKEYNCMKPCTRTLCTNGHRCQKPCHVDCGRCMSRMNKLIPRCGHVQKVPCSVEPATFSCRETCEHVLTCGHNCQNPCGEVHTAQCMTVVTTQLKCGHQVDIYCFEANNDIECPFPCEKVLQCEHKCKGSCGKCFEGRLHQPCKYGVCGRVLVCGHQCKDPCTVSCPPCKAKCQNQCTHSRCQRKCGEPCKRCIEPCAWRCRHHRCTKLCHESCNRPRCDLPCRLQRPCGHPCIGLCGEPCPRKCRVCDRQEVQTIIFGNEDEPDARFIQLQDCKHIVEVGALDQWMTTTADVKDGDLTVQLKLCPICKTPIRRNLRYGNMINSSLADIEQVKDAISGDKALIAQRRMEVQRNWNEIKCDDRMEVRRRLENDYLQLEEATALLNSVEFLKSLRNSEKALQEIRAKLNIRRDNKVIDKLIEKLRDFIHGSLRYSDQTLNECTMELNRIRMLVSTIIVQHFAHVEIITCM